MGLIRATFGAVGGTLKDQWKEALRCEDLGNDILMKKVTTPTGVITNKSTIIVGPGQCAIIYDNGRVLDATAEEVYILLIVLLLHLSLLDNLVQYLKKCGKDLHIMVQQLNNKLYSSLTLKKL